MGEFVCGYVLTFKDGGEPEEQVIGRGTMEECQQLGDMLPAVCYNGDRPVHEARFVIVPDSAAAPAPEGETE